MEIPPTKLRAITSKQVDQTKPASIVINKFGGLTKFCQLTGFPTSTAHAWTIRGYIPPHGRGDQRSISYHAQILAVARENNIVLSGADFVDQPVEAIAANG